MLMWYLIIREKCITKGTHTILIINYKNTANSLLIRYLLLIEPASPIKMNKGVRMFVRRHFYGPFLPRIDIKQSFRNHTCPARTFVVSPHIYTAIFHTLKA